MVRPPVHPQPPACPQPPVCPQQLSEEFGAGPRQLVLTVGQSAPHRGGHGDGVVVGGEALDRQRSRIGDLVEGVEDRVPIGVVSPDRPAVVAADLHHPQVRPGRPDGRGGRALLDVEVVAVQGQADPAVQERVEGLEGLVDGVDDARLIAVERLHGQCDPALGRIACDRPQGLPQAREHTGPLIGVHSPHPAGAGGERSGHGRRSHSNRHVHAVAQVVLRIRPRGLIDEVATGPHRPDDPRAHVGRGQRLGGGSGVPSVQTLHRQLQQIEPEASGPIRQFAEAGVGQRRHPHPRVDADLTHCCPLHSIGRSVRPFDSALHSIRG